MKTFLVYYAKPGCSSTFRWNDGETVRKDEVLQQQTHVLVTAVRCIDFTTVWGKMQGEIWSPNGEAKRLIRNLNLEHTSMDIGDAIYDPSIDELQIVQGHGFKKS